MDFKKGGQAIQRIRKERGLTQEQLADKAAITSSSALLHTNDEAL